MLTISVKNFGPIAEGSVDLKPLTIFVGPSNTGKSYMATAVYAVMQGFEGPYHWMSKVDSRSDVRGHSTLQMKAPSGRLVTARNGGFDAVDALIKWAGQLPKGEMDLRQIYFSSVSNELQEELKHSIETMLGWIIQDIIEKVSDTYGESSSFVRQGCKNADFLISVDRQDPLLGIAVPPDGYTSRKTDFDISGGSFKQPHLEPLSDHEILDSDPDRVKRLAEYRYLEILDSVAEPVFSGLPRQSSTSLASRSGLAHSYKILSASIVRQWSGVRVHDPSRATLPGAQLTF